MLRILEKLYIDIIEHGGVHIIGNKQVGKSNLKKTLVWYAIEHHPENKTIIIDPEGKWEFDFGEIRFLRIPKNSMKISEEPIGRRLNGAIFTRKIYKLDPTIEAEVLKLIRDPEPILFIVELDDPEECGFFSAFIIETCYDMQRISRKYHKGKLPKSYMIVLEEAENIFDQTSLEKKLFNKLRKKYAEMANLHIGILSSSQRLTEVNKKFRAKMNGYLVGFILEDDFIGQIQRMLKLKLGKEAKKVIEQNFRWKFYYTATSQIIHVPKFQAKQKPIEIKIRRKPKQPSELWRNSIPKLKPKKLSTWQRLLKWLFPKTPQYHKNLQSDTEQDESEELNAMLAEDFEEEETFMW